MLRIFVIDVDSRVLASRRCESKKGVQVQTRGFENKGLTATPRSLLSPTMQMSSYAAPLTAAQVVSTNTTDAEAEWPPETVVDWGDLGKGVRWALTIEGILALVFYGGWQLLHFWR